MVALGLVEAGDRRDIVLAEYEGYARNAIVQLRRVREGTTLEEDHMRNRQAIVALADGAYDRDRAPGPRRQDVLRDGRRGRFRDGAGRMLGEIQRIKAQADYAAAAALFEAHGTHFDPALRDEVLARTEALDLPPTPVSCSRNSSPCATRPAPSPTCASRIRAT